MKRIFFILAIVVISTLLVLAFLSRDRTDTSIQSSTIDLSEWSKLFRWNEKAHAFAPEKEGKRAVRGVYYEKITPIDGIYYRDISRAPIKPLRITQKWDTVTIELKRGIYVCDFQSNILKYEIRMEWLVLRPSGRGVFLVDLTQSEPTVFSYNSFLKADLIGANQSIATQFTLFPSLLFRYDPSNTSELKKADLIRVATIDTIRYVDVRREEGIHAVFGSDNADGMQLFEIARTDIGARITAFNQLYRAALETDLSRLQEEAETDPNSPLFINATKKEVVLKNILLEKILSIMRAPDATTRSADRMRLSEILSDMEHESPGLYDAGIALLKKYLYIGTFSSFASSDKTAIIARKESLYLSIASDILSPRHAKEASYYGIASIFSHYYFNNLTTNEFNAYFREYLGNLVQAKTIEKADFLYFSFFITQYLASGPFIPDENTLQIMFSLFTVTDEYYGTVVNDQNATTILSTIFYSYNQGFSRLLRVFTETFFDTTSPKGLVLRPEYLNGDSPNLSQSFLDLFKNLTNTLANDLNRKKSRFYAGQAVARQSTVQDNFIILSKTHGQLDALRKILFGYPEYAKTLELNEQNRTAKGILFSSAGMSTQSAQQYLSTFNDLDISTLRIDNDFKRDGYYDVSVSIAGRDFKFYLYPDGHVISNISFVDTDRKKHAFPNITVGLDEKAAQMRSSSASTDDPKLRYRQDFKNYFKTAFIENPDSGAIATLPSDPLSSHPKMDTAMQLFVQNELIEKDFKNIVNTLRIDFSNIYATIRNGTYSIDLSSIKYGANNNGQSFLAEISGKYLFDSHTFYRLTCQVRKSEGNEYDFNGATITLLPSRIPLQNIEASLRDLGAYLSTVSSNIWDNAVAEIDFTAKKVRIGGREYTPDFTPHP